MALDSWSTLHLFPLFKAINNYEFPLLMVENIMFQCTFQHFWELASLIHVQCTLVHLKIQEIAKQ